MFHKKIMVVLLISLMAVPFLSFGQNAAKFMTKMKKLQAKGQFQKASESVGKYLKKTKKLKADEKEQLLFFVEQLDRIRNDFSDTREDLLTDLKKRVKNFYPEELDKWEKEGRIQSRMIDGKTGYFGANVSNLFFRYPEIRARNLQGGDRKLLSNLIDEARLVRNSAKYEKDFFSLPRSRQMRFELDLKEAPEFGDLLEVWLPYPLDLPFQTEVQTIDAATGLAFIAQPQAKMRTAYFRRKYIESSDLSFSVSYELTTWARYCQVDPAMVMPTPEIPSLQEFLVEQKPHVQFLPRIKKQVQKIIGKEENPYLKAQKIYQWFGEEFVYSYAYEYSTMEDISAFTFDNMYGDCGQLAMLYITMCRIAGVPARWQTGWMLYPSHNGIHDWAEIYIEPYGWLPVDPWVPVAFNSGDTSESEQDIQDTIQFYFGNMGTGRLYINQDFGKPFTPPKKGFRSDTVDFQRGEVDVNGENRYFGTFSYKLRILADDRDSK